MSAPAVGLPGNLPVLLFSSTAQWDRWLSRNVEAPGVWMRIAKKAAPLRSISYAEALDVALCHGWIDSLKRSYDDESFAQKFTPRGPRSVWSKINRDKVTALIADGRMKPAGHRAVERAKSNGRWHQAYDPHSSAEPHPEFKAALNRNPKAKAFFATLTGSARYAFLFRIQTAVKPETRVRRIAEYVAILARGETLHSIEAARLKARKRKQS